MITIANLNEFISELEIVKRYSSHTLIAYKKDVTQFFTFLSSIEDDISQESIQYMHIRSWVVDLAENELANRSINRKMVSLRSFFKYLKKVGKITINPCDKITALKIPKRLPQYIRKSELTNLYDIIIQDSDSFLQWRDYAIIELLYNTGIRKSELIHISLDHINHQDKFLVVFGKGKKERVIPLGEALMQIIDSYLLMRDKLDIIDDSFLFVSDSGRKLYPKAIYNIAKKYLSLLTTVEKKSPHILRHSFATHLMNEGAELSAVKNLLGHSSLAATQIYTHNSIETLKDIYKNAHPKGK